MKQILYITCMAVCGFLVGCTLEDLTGETGDSTATVTVQAVFPDDFNELIPGHPKDGMAIEIRNTVTGSAYNIKTNRDGRITQEVEYGSYNVYAHTEVKEGSITVILSGTATVRVLEDSDLTNPLVINTTMSFKSPLILSEVYYTSSTNSSGGNYLGNENDRYYVVYNNSGETQYADGLGIWTHSSLVSGTSSGISNWFKAGTQIPRDSLPTSWGGYVIPGNGTDHPIEPGGEIIIAHNGTDHPTIAGAAAGRLYVNLDRNNVWVPWQSSFNPVGGNSRPMYSYKPTAGSGKVYQVAMNTPSIAIYRMQDDFLNEPLVVPDTLTYYEALALKYVEGYPVSGARSNPVVYNPTAYTGSTQHILIPWQWVLDGIEVFGAESHFKRLPSMIDIGYIYPALSMYSGRTLVRIVDDDATAEAGGRTVYKDTNNASNDWEIQDAPTLLNR